MTAAQLAFEVATALCDYGTPQLGEVRPCSDPATHRACWLVPPTYRDGSPNSRSGNGSLDCCLVHANYYACAWVASALLYPAVCDTTWMEALPG